MNKKRASDCLTHLQSALKVSALYPEGHPGIQNPLQNFIRELSQLLQAGRPLVLGIVDDVLAFDEVPFYDTDTTWRNLFVSLQGRGIESITFQPGIEVDEALGIVKILTGGDSEDGDDLAALWKNYAIQHAVYTELATTDDTQVRAHRIYSESLCMIMNVMTELRVGRIPSTRAAVAVVDSMRDLMLDDPNALMGMAMLKSYDDYTYNHSVNVAVLCLALGLQLELVPAELSAFGIAALLHDVGKVRTNETIIRKPGRLNDEEMRLIKLHSELGAEILESMQGMDPAARTMSSNITSASTARAIRSAWQRRRSILSPTRSRSPTATTRSPPPDPTGARANPARRCASFRAAPAAHTGPTSWSSSSACSAPIRWVKRCAWPRARSPWSSP